MKGDLEVGSYKKFPHVSVVGEPTMFYLWINEGYKCEPSSWFKGDLNTYHLLARLHKKDKKEFEAKVRDLHKANKKP